MKLKVGMNGSELLKGPNLIKIAVLSFISLVLVLYLGKHLYYYSDSEHLPLPPFTLSHLFFFFTPTSNSTPSTLGYPPSPSPLEAQSQIPSRLGFSNESQTSPETLLAPPPPVVELERMGIVDDNGAMSDDFKVGDFNSELAEEVGMGLGTNTSNEAAARVRRRIPKYKSCNARMTDYIPCFSSRRPKFERHCPSNATALNCLVPPPPGYRSPIHWPQSRDEVWFSNVPHARLVEDKGGQNWISIRGHKFVFPGGGTQFIHGADKYLDQIEQMVPDIGFGHHARVALDVGCGVASFGAFLMQRNVTTMSIAPKDVHENQIQFALERGVPAMISAFGTRRLLYPSQAFDLIHCSRCRINWTQNDGILLLEANRMLRAGGYFVWAAQPVYKHEDNLQQQWKEMENLTRRICWELVKKEGYIAIWRKPLNNSCYLNRESSLQPTLCELTDNPDDVWYVDLKPCITKLPAEGYGANISKWPERLHLPPDRLQSIEMDAYISRKEIFKAESKYWKEIIGSYINAYRWKEFNLRNVMDMRAGFGGFAAALHDLQLQCWVMNVVPVSGFNTLPVIYDRGLLGALHDWCEPFDTYPRTYDLLHAAGLFSVEKKRCDVSTIMLEMDRMLRPGGRVYIRDSILIVEELQEIAAAIRWACSLHDTGEGPHASWKILRCDKPI